MDNHHHAFVEEDIGRILVVAVVVGSPVDHLVTVYLWKCQSEREVISNLKMSKRCHVVLYGFHVKQIADNDFSSNSVVSLPGNLIGGC